MFVSPRERAADLVHDGGEPAIGRHLDLVDHLSRLTLVRPVFHVEVREEVGDGDAVDRIGRGRYPDDDERRCRKRREGGPRPEEAIENRPDPPLVARAPLEVAGGVERRRTGALGDGAGLHQRHPPAGHVVQREDMVERRVLVRAAGIGRRERRSLAIDLFVVDGGRWGRRRRFQIDRVGSERREVDGGLNLANRGRCTAKLRRRARRDGRRRSVVITTAERRGGHADDTQTEGKHSTTELHSNNPPARGRWGYPPVHDETLCFTSSNTEPATADDVTRKPTSRTKTVRDDACARIGRLFACWKRVSDKHGLVV